ncbi:hypothetical protein B0A55_03899 [Friedmanniomyces simplex]|uniref:Uncharacterized protein n=1 Tax=Friedmanniomyces simplex TaxID=329884 RepID=A0A4U0XLN0_9PEZI|nr:hypothetical protein B0A55_03899 [Friedmanniomyces simplex]
MTVYNRQATTVCGARNNSILSVYDLGDPQLDEGVNITALRLAVGWLLNYTAAGLPAESSLNFWFWFDPTGTYSSIWEANAYTALQSLLAFILWEFCTNNNENPAVAAEQTGGQPNLPAAFQTTASLSEPYTRFVLNRAAFITYLSLEAFALAFCWAIFVWQCVQAKRLPEISSYPPVDFASKLRERRASDDALSESLHSLVPPEADETASRHSLAKVRVTVVRRKIGIAETKPVLAEVSRPDGENSRLVDAVQLHARENMEDRVPAVIRGADNIADLPKQMRPDGHDQLPAQSGSSDASAFDSEAHRGPDTSASRPMAAAADTGTAGTVEPEPDLSDSK